MSRTAKKAIEQEAQPQLLFDAKRDFNPYWRSSLFSDVYLKNDVPREYKHLWENDEIGSFYNFYQGFIDLCVETEHEAFHKWREADTVKNWIVHVMDLLGWEDNSEKRSNSYMDNESFTVRENGRKQTFRPDLIYFDKPKHKSYTQKEKDIDRKLLEAKDKRTGAKIIVEAKYWDRLSNVTETTRKESEENDSASALGPELQTLKYMEIFDHEFGILTDGKTWRLFHKDLSQGMDRRSFDFDLGNLRELALDLGSSQNEEKFRHYAKYFFYFFSKESLIQTSSSKTAPFVHEVFEYSKKYAHSIEDDLKKRFIISMGVTCNALKESCDELGESWSVETIRNVAESHLFNILFVKSCEVRRILPISSTKYLRVSLHEVIETLDAMSFDPEKDLDDYLRDFRFTFGKRFDWDGYDIFNRFVNLYEIIHDGTAKSKDFGFEIEGFKESIFSKEEWKFAKKHKVNNKKMIDILFSLNFIESSHIGRKYQQIPYSYFTPRQLGGIYESFLEYKLEVASEDLIFTKGCWKAGNHKSNKVKSLKLVDKHLVKKGELFFSPDNKERKMTGAYYTPDYIVKYIVEDTLKPLVENIKSKDIFNLKIIDPAMGSGHFLVGVVDYLAETYRIKWCDENNDDLKEDLSETSRNILDSCIFGVDINARAVKLAKMSLWLSTAFPGKKLERLSDQLISTDGLELNVKKDFKGFESFDAIVMNPPYVSELRGNKDIFQKYAQSKHTKDFYEAKMDLFYFFICKGLDYLKDNGRLGLICEQYWLTRSNTSKLHTKIYQDSFLEKHINFGSNIIFESAPGVHAAILVMEKGKKFNSEKTQEMRFNKVYKTQFEIENELLNADFRKSEIVYDKKNGRFIDSATIINRSSNYYIDTEFIQQGLVTPQDSVNKKHIEIDSDFNLGDGIFLLNQDEVDSINFSAMEMEYIRPFYEAKTVPLYSGLGSPEKYVIYIGSKESKKLVSGELKLPKIQEHMDYYSEVITSSNKPYGLHRARQEHWFSGNSRILSIRKTKKPHFCYVEKDSFVNQSINVIDTGIDFLNKIYTILLNSERTYEVLKKIKTQGDQLQVDKEALLRVPLPLWTNPKSFVEKNFKQENASLYKEVNDFFKIRKNMSEEELREKGEYIASKLWQIESDMEAAA